MAGRAAVTVAVSLLCGACVPGMTSPARDAGDYREKASTTAGAAASAVATVELLVAAARHDDATAAYLSVAVGDAERDLDATASTFGGILPPGPSSIRQRDEVVAVLDRAADDVADARIAIRRGDPRGLSDVQRALRRDIAALQDLEERTS